MDANALRQIVEEVVARYTPSQAKSVKLACLTLVCAATSAFDVVAQQLQSLGTTGAELSIVASRNAATLLGEERIRTRLGGSVEVEPPLSRLQDLIANKNVVLAPLLSRTTALKVALGIPDGAVSNLLHVALAAGLPTLACCAPEGAQSDYSRPLPGLEGRWQEAKRSLQNAGLVLIEPENIAKAVQAAGSRARAEAVGAVQDVVSSQELARVPDGGQITVVRGAIITPLAQDEIRTRDINVLFVEPGGGS